MIRLLIVDDQRIVREGLEIILGRYPDIDVVGAVADGREAVEVVPSLEPDVILMDLRMPRMNGIHATRKITQDHPDIQIIALTTYDDDEWVFDAIKAGASGYLLKDNDHSEVLDAVRSVQKGKVKIDPQVAGKVLQEFKRLHAHAPSGFSVPSTGEAAASFETLTERETEVLQLLAQGYTNQEIAETLFLALGTVKNYVSSIINKLHVNDRTQAVIYALRQGFIDLEPD